VQPDDTSAPHDIQPQPFSADEIEADLAAVEVALARLDAGTYWTDEVTGEPLSEELLHQHPAARRA